VLATINGMQLSSASSTISVSVSPTGTVATVTPTFTWPAVAGANYYVLKVTDKTTNRLVLNLTNLASAIYTLTSAQALTPGHSYTWTAQGVTSSNNTVSAISNEAFSVAALGVPVPVGPSGPTATDMPTFTWTAVTDATHTAAGHFTLKVTDTKTHTVLTIPNVTGTSYTLSTVQALTPGHSYTWSVAAVSSNGLATVSSNTSSNPTFTVEQMAVPTPTGPTGTMTTDRPTFTWIPLINANFTAPGTYTLKVTDKTTGQVITIGKLVGTSYTLTAAQALTPGHKYTWSVTAVSTNGMATIASNSKNFSIAALTAPVLVSVSAANPPTFTWQPVTDANHYDLKILNSAGQAVVSEPVVPGTSYTLTSTQANALKSGQDYTWYVAAFSTNGKGINWSLGQKFTAS